MKKNNEAPVTYDKNNLILQNEQPKDKNNESSVSSMMFSTVVLNLTNEKTTGTILTRSCRREESSEHTKHTVTFDPLPTLHNRIVPSRNRFCNIHVTHADSRCPFRFSMAYITSFIILNVYNINVIIYFLNRFTLQARW